MAEQRMKARDKKVQKMTRDGLVQENLGDKSTVRVSKRDGEMKLEHREQPNADLQIRSERSVVRSRDEPARSRGKKNRKYRTEKKPVRGTKLKEKERMLSGSRGDSRREETGGTRRPKQKRRLQFSSKEADVDDSVEKGIFTETAASTKTATSAKSAPYKIHSNKQKKYREQDIPIKKKSKLAFSNDEVVAMAGKKTVGTAAGAASAVIHQEISEYEDDNAAVQGAHRLEEGTEGSGRLISSTIRSRSLRTKRNGTRTIRNAQGTTWNAQGTIRDATRTESEHIRNRFGTLYREARQKEENDQSRSLMKKQIQKIRIKREYAKAKRAEAFVGTAPKGSIDYIKKVGGKITNFFKEHRKVYIGFGVLIGLIFLIVSSFTSCSSVFIQNVVTYSGASYMSSDEALRDADLYYSQLEANLQEQINNEEINNSGYDRYQYQIDEIGHDPFILASYLSAKYETFEFDSTIQAELDELFARQYHLSEESSTDTIIETKTIRVGESLGEVVTSGYCSCSICCGQWAGGATASGAAPTANHTIAVDAYNPKVPMGTRVIMNGVEYTVEDTGAFASYGVDFDVYYDNHDEALQHGHQTWEAYLADDNGSQEVQVTTTSEESVYSVTLTSQSLTAICQNRLSATQKEVFSGYNTTKGNLQMFETPVDMNWYTRVSSYYGYRIDPITGENVIHNGLDIAATEGTTVSAGLTGTVTTSAYNDSYGNYVIIEDENGYEIRYAHLASRSVNAGADITKGDEIGTVGSTGDSTGPHLHLELLHNGVRLNPIFYFETGESAIAGDVQYSSEEAKTFVEYSLQFLGTPYVWGGYSPDGFDCSGFVSYCLTNSGVLNTGHMTCNGLLEQMTVIPESEMQPGDIIFFQGTYDEVGASHVGIYIGNGQMVHSGEPNQISDIYSAYYQEHWLCVARW